MAQIIASTYEIIEELGSGGGGIAYLANHLRLHKKVVLKADRRKAWFHAARFRREVDILKELSHTYIPQVYDYFIDQDTAITVIDYIEGESLDKPLKRGERFSQPQVIKWAVQLLQALNYLHSPIHGDPPRGYVHSDIKPANIMRKPNGDICLIDFNIALALGEETAIGRSEGYSSPEHYGLDYSSGSSSISEEDDATDTEEATVTQSESVTLTDSGVAGGTSSSVKKILPDTRSDIYSLGATLYHLLGGERPARNAQDVKPLSKQEFSPQLVDIISRAMDPNPDLRYQSAEEMLDAILGLWDNDIRRKRQKRRAAVSFAGCAVLLAAGIFTAFTGLKRMQTREQWQKLAGQSENALEAGDRVQAVEYAMQALHKTSDLFQPGMLPEAQKALTDALGVYDLADGFRPYRITELPTKPQLIELSPEGTTAICLCEDVFVVVNTESGEIIANLPAERSALSEAIYQDDHTVIYAGAEGISAYDIDAQRILWTGDPVTAISISGDGTQVAGVYKDQTFVKIYDTENGAVVGTLDLGTLHQSVPMNDQFADPDQSAYSHLLELNEDGTLLGISFSTGELEILDLQNPEDTLILAEAEEGFTHFEGGFYGPYFAVSLSRNEYSVFELVDTVKQTLVPMDDWGAFHTLFGVQCDPRGIFVKQQNKIMQVDPETGTASSMVTMDTWVERFASNGTDTIVGLKNEVLFFDVNAVETARYDVPGGPDFLRLGGDTAVAGSRNEAFLRIYQYEYKEDSSLLTYHPDPLNPLPEARVSADGKTILRFSNAEMLIYDRQGNLLKEIAIQDPEQVYDQQFRRSEESSWLEVTYYDGHRICYSAVDGSVISEDQIGPQDRSLYEVLETEHYYAECPLHGVPEVYRKDTGEQVAVLKEAAYLTYLTETRDFLIAQYITYDLSRNYGILMNKNCEALAELPYLCDVAEDILYFNYPSGTIKSSEIYTLEDLVSMGTEKVEEWK